MLVEENMQDFWKANYKTKITIKSKVTSFSLSRNNQSQQIPQKMESQHQNDGFWCFDWKCVSEEGSEEFVLHIDEDSLEEETHKNL